MTIGTGTQIEAAEGIGPNARRDKAGA